MLRSSYESVPEQLISAPEQLISLPEQLYVFRSSNKSSGTVISLPEQLEVFRSSFESVTDQLRKCSGVVTKVFLSS